MAAITPEFKLQGECGSTGNVYTCIRYGETTVSPVADVGGSGDSGGAYRNWIYIRFADLPSSVSKATLTVNFDIANSDYKNADITISHQGCANFTNSTSGTSRPSVYGSAVSKTIEGGKSKYSIDVTDQIQSSLSNGYKCLRLSADVADNRKRISTIKLVYDGGSIIFNGDEVTTLKWKYVNSSGTTVTETVTSLIYNGTTVY